MDEKVNVCEELYRVERSADKKGETVEYLFPYEQKIGVEELIIILEKRGKEIQLLTIQGEDRNENPPVYHEY